MTRDELLTKLARELDEWPRKTWGKMAWLSVRESVPEATGINFFDEGPASIEAGGYEFTGLEWMQRREELAAARHWSEGEERMEAIGPNGPTGDHYAEDSDGESALSQALREQDAGAHYRREYRGIKLDPYRIAKIYAMQGGPREQIMKKCLRFTDKGQTEQQVVNEIRTALNRWQEMLEEDGQ